MHYDTPILVVSILDSDDGVMREHRDEVAKQLVLDTGAVVVVVGAKRGLDRLHAKHRLFAKLVS